MTYDFTLHGGKGASPDEACVMQRAALMHAERHGYLDLLPLEAVLTDRPCWANQSLTAIAIRCNDACSDVDRQRMRPLLERVLLATRKSPEVERRIDARLLCQQARKVLHLAEDREVCERAIATREAWLAGEATEDDCAEAAGAARAAGAAWAAEAAGAARAVAGAAWAAEAAGAARAVAGAAWAAGAAGAAGAAWAAWAARTAGAAGEADWVEWLDDALDAWEKAAAEEGVLADDTEAERLVAEFVQTAGS